MRKSLYGVLLLVLLLPILAACGTGETGGATTSGAASTVASTSSTAASTAASTAGASDVPSTAASTDSSAAASAMGAMETATTGGMMATETATSGGTGNASNIKVALVTDVGKVNDGTFNQFAYEGLQRAGKELGVQTDYIETQNGTDYEKNLEQFATGGYQLVIGVGFLMGDAMKTVSSRHPDVNFAIVDSTLR